MEKICINYFFLAGAFSSPPACSGSPGPGLPGRAIGLKKVNPEKYIFFQIFAIGHHFSFKALPEARAYARNSGTNTNI